MNGNITIQENPLIQELHTIGDAGAERFVIASCFACPSGMPEAEATLTPESFWISIHRMIWEVMLRIARHARARNIRNGSELKSGFPVHFDKGFARMIDMASYITSAGLRLPSGWVNRGRRGRRGLLSLQRASARSLGRREAFSRQIRDNRKESPS